MVVWSGVVSGVSVAALFAVSRIGHGGYRGSVGDQSGTLEAIDPSPRPRGPSRAASRPRRQS